MEYFKNLEIDDLNGEIWKDISGYEGRYMISNLGRVKSFVKTLPFIRKQSNKKGNYKEVNLKNLDKSYSYFTVHRLVASAFIPNPENKPFINHIDCNTENNVVSNLEWCTPKENMEHCVKLNRTYKYYKRENKKIHNAKLNEDLVRQIRKMYYDEKMGQIDIAKKLNVNKNAVSGVITWRTWFYVDPHLKEYYLSIKPTKNKNNNK